MKAIVQDTYGSADVLQLRDIAAPVPGRGEVLVRVRAAGADPGVWHTMTGVPYLMRVLGFGFRRPRVPVRGLALAGVVEAVGPEAGTFRPGDFEILYFADGDILRPGDLHHAAEGLPHQRRRHVPNLGARNLRRPVEKGFHQGIERHEGPARKEQGMLTHRRDGWSSGW